MESPAQDELDPEAEKIRRMMTFVMVTRLPIFPVSEAPL